jgi:hypothetical protein
MQKNVIIVINNLSKYTGKVRDHCHLREKDNYRGAACEKCNASAQRIDT